MDAGMVTMVVDMLKKSLLEEGKVVLHPISFPNPDNRFVYFMRVQRREPQKGEDIDILRLEDGETTIIKNDANFEKVLTADKKGVMMNQDAKDIMELDAEVRDLLAENQGDGFVKKEGPVNEEASLDLYRLAGKSWSGYMPDYDSIDELLAEAEEILAAGADPDFSKDGWDNTFGKAVWANNVRLVELLLNRKANVNWSDNNGKTALMDASRSNDTAEMTKLLLDHGADPAAKSSSEWTCLHWAGDCAGHSEMDVVVDLLLKAGTPAAAVNSRGDTALSLATGTETYSENGAAVREKIISLLEAATK